MTESLEVALRELASTLESNSLYGMCSRTSAGLCVAWLRANHGSPQAAAGPAWVLLVQQVRRPQPAPTLSRPACPAARPCSRRDLHVREAVA